MNSNFQKIKNFFIMLLENFLISKKKYLKSYYISNLILDK